MISAFDSLIVAPISGMDNVARLALVLLLCNVAFCLSLEGSMLGGIFLGESMLHV